ncbi:MAG: hypothetical protein AAF570_14440, partial [Bacteroidota bacterium]
MNSNRIKHLLAFFFALALGMELYGQTPQLVNYQGVARDVNGQALTNQAIGLRLSIHTTTPAGPIVYQETQSLTTNQLGLFNTQIGGGTVVSGNMAGINWGSDAHYFEVEMDASGGTNYQALGSSQLISVPYALYALNVENDNVNDADNDPN